MRTSDRSVDPEGDLVRAAGARRLDHHQVVTVDGEHDRRPLLVGGEHRAVRGDDRERDVVDEWRRARPSSARLRRQDVTVARRRQDVGVERGGVRAGGELDALGAGSDRILTVSVYVGEESPGRRRPRSCSRRWWAAAPRSRRPAATAARGRPGRTPERRPVPVGRSRRSSSPCAAAQYVAVALALAERAVHGGVVGAGSESDALRRAARRRDRHVKAYVVASPRRWPIEIV